MSNSYDEFAGADIQGGPDPARQLIHRNNNIELIEENRARLQFFQEHLEHSADESAAIRYLQQRHSQFLEGVVEADEEPGDQTNDTRPELGEAAD